MNADSGERKIIKLKNKFESVKSRLKNAKPSIP